MEILHWFGGDGTSVPDVEGETVFFVREDGLRRMLSALFGVSGEADPSVPARLCIADAEDPVCRDAAVRCARESGAALLAFAEDPRRWEAPEGLRSACLARPFPLDSFAQAAAALCREREPAEAAPVPDFRWDAAGGRIVYGGEEIRLTPREASLFALLYAASPAPVARDTLRAPFSRRDGNGADVYVGYLRRRLRGTPARLISVRGEGYALVFCAALPSDDKTEVDERV